MSVIYEALKKLDGQQGAGPAEGGNAGKGRKRPPRRKSWLLSARMLFLYGVLMVAAAFFVWLLYQEQRIKEQLTPLPARRSPPPGLQAEPDAPEPAREPAVGDEAPAPMAGPQPRDKGDGDETVPPSPGESPRGLPAEGAPRPAEDREEQVLRNASDPPPPAMHYRASRPDPFRGPTEQEIIRELERMQKGAPAAASLPPVEPARVREEAGSAPAPREERSPTAGATPSAGDEPAVLEDASLPAITAKISRVSMLANDIGREMARGNPAEVERLLAELKTLKKPDDPFVRKVDAFLLIRKGDFTEAREVLAGLVEKNRFDTEAALNMAIVEYNQGERGKARARLRELAEVYPSDPRVKKLLEQMR